MIRKNNLACLFLSLVFTTMLLIDRLNDLLSYTKRPKMATPCQIWSGLCTQSRSPSPISLRYVYFSALSRIKSHENRTFGYIQVGKETIHSSDDAILKQDMPASLHRVEGAARLLEEASSMLKADPYSGPARYAVPDDYLMRLQFINVVNKQEEVDWRIPRYPSRHVIALALFWRVRSSQNHSRMQKGVGLPSRRWSVESMEDLVQFVKDLSPCLTRVSREVDARQKELTHQVHRDILIRCLEQVKTLAPILICSMKIFIQIVSQGNFIDIHF